MCTPFFLAISTFLAFVAFVALGANVDCDPAHQPATHSGITNPRRLFVETHLCCRLRVRVRDRLARNLGRSGGLRSSQPLFQKVHQVQVSRPTNVTAPPDLWPYEGKFHKRGAERNLFKSTCFNQELYRWWSGTYHSHHCVNCNPVEQHYLLPSPLLLRASVPFFVSVPFLSDPGLINVSNLLQTKMKFAQDMTKLFVNVVTRIYSAVERN